MQLNLMRICFKMKLNLNHKTYVEDEFEEMESNNDTSQNKLKEEIKQSVAQDRN